MSLAKAGIGGAQRVDPFWIEDRPLAGVGRRGHARAGTRRNSAARASWCRSQVLEGDSREQAGAGVGHAGELVQRGRGILGTVDALDAPWLAGVGQFGGEQARAVEEQEGIEVLDLEGVEACGVALRDVHVAEDLAHHGAVLGLGCAACRASRLRGG